MAITVRTTQEHEEMLHLLKQKTGINTTSKALLYAAEYYPIYNYRYYEAVDRIKELESQLARIHKLMKQRQELDLTLSQLTAQTSLY